LRKQKGDGATMRAELHGYSECWLCKRTGWIEYHHIFQGAYKKASEKYGFVVPLCYLHHNVPPEGVHHNRTNNLKLKRWAQASFEETHTRDEFRAEFGKSYL